MVVAVVVDAVVVGVRGVWACGHAPFAGITSPRLRRACTDVTATRSSTYGRVFTCVAWQIRIVRGARLGGVFAARAAFPRRHTATATASGTSFTGGDPSRAGRRMPLYLLRHRGCRFLARPAANHWNE
jgi:hypothetical protein